MALWGKIALGDVSKGAPPAGAAAQFRNRPSGLVSLSTANALYALGERSPRVTGRYISR